MTNEELYKSRTSICRFCHSKIPPIVQVGHSSGMEKVYRRKAYPLCGECIARENKIYRMIHELEFTSRCLICGEKLYIKHSKGQNYCEICSGIMKRLQMVKIKIRRLVKRFPDRVEIISRCNCKDNRRHRHHPDYEQPFRVMEICPCCHSGIHALKLKKENLPTDRADALRIIERLEEVYRVAMDNNH